MKAKIAMQKITPHLWFDKEAKEAAEFYASSFTNSKVTNVRTLHNTPSGDCDIVSFELSGRQFRAISAGPLFKFNPSISFHVKCKTKDEVEALWNKLSESGTALMELGAYPWSERYGWLQDKYGLSWQIVPRALQQLMSDPDPKKSASVMQAMLQMDKIDIEALKRAHEKAA